MAYSVVDTHIQNPARAGKGKKRMATRRKMSAKQIKHFGTARQKAALKASRSRKRNAAPKRRHAPARRNPPKGGGRVISGYGSTVMNPRRRRRNPGNHKIVINPTRKRRRVVAKKSTVKRRRNPLAQILSWTAGNPAKRRNTVARSRRKTKRRATAHRSNAGRRRAAPKRVMHHRRRSNPAGLGRPMDWLQGGAGVIAGVVGTRALPQMILGASNTGPMGYVANAVAAVGIGWLSHILLKKPAITAAVIAGGFATLLSRIIADKTPFGAQLSLTGLGDHGFGLYQKSNYPAPPHLIGGTPGQPASSNFTWGDGSQSPAMSAPYGNDSTAAC